MKIEDKISNEVMNFAHSNFGNYPEYILIHPLNFQELVTDLANYKGWHQEPKDLKFMGAKLIQSLDISKDLTLHDSIICCSTKLK